MNAFQTIAILVILTLAFAVILAALRGWLERKELFTWLAISGAAAMAILWPNVTTKAARLLGISRGADLLLYAAVGLMAVGFLMTYTRLRKIRREMTLLVRHIALDEAEEPPFKVS